MTEYEVVMGLDDAALEDLRRWHWRVRISIFSPLLIPFWIKRRVAELKHLSNNGKRVDRAQYMRDWRTKRRGGPSRKWFSWKGRTDCPAGHALTGENRRYRRHSDGSVDMCCRICDNARQAAYRVRKLARSRGEQ